MIQDRMIWTLEVLETRERRGEVSRFPRTAALAMNTNVRDICGVCLPFRTLSSSLLPSDDHLYQPGGSVEVRHLNYSTDTDPGGIFRPDTVRNFAT